MNISFAPSAPAELQRLAARVGQAELGVAVQLLARIDQLDLTAAAVSTAVGKY